MAFFERTSAVIEKTIKDLRRLSFWGYLIVQIIFLLLYTFKIVMSRGKLVYLILYSILAGLSVFGFVFYLVTYHNKKQRSIIMTKRSIRFGKYFANAAMVIVILVEFAQGGVSDLSIILSGISIASFVGQILIEIIRLFYERYAELLQIALEKDIAALEPLTHPLKALDTPLAALANKIKGSKPEELKGNERYVEDLKEDYQAKKKKSKEERSREEKRQIRTHLKTIKEGIKKKFSRPKKLKQVREEQPAQIEPPKKPTP